MTDKQSNQEEILTHSITSPSSAHRWIRCPGSHKYNLEFKGNKFTEEGQNAHLEIAKTYDECDNKYKYYKLMELRHIFGIRLYLRESEIYREVLVVYQKDKSFFGRSDIIILSKEELHVLDYKHGTHVQAVTYNYQLLSYLLLATSMFGVKPKRLYIHIIQPRANPSYIASQQITHRELKKFEDKCNGAREEVIAGSTRLNPGEVQCEWCAFKDKCEAYDWFLLKREKKLYGK